MDITYTKLLWTINVFLVATFISSLGFAQDFSSVKKLCEDRDSNKSSLAKRAGYDLDMLCSNVNSAVVKSTKPILNANPSVHIPRKTVSSGSLDKNVVNLLPPANSPQPDPKSKSSVKPFGYDLFANVPNTFAPNNNISVPLDYLLGPGDTLDVLFYGKTNKSFSIEINRDGLVNFPELGPVRLIGLTFSEAKEMLQKRIDKQMIGTSVSITMGDLRSIQIFVLGEAFKPGAYTVSSLSTITHALISSGGISGIASLRNVQLKRGGKLMSTLDLYDLIIFGDTSKDIRLQNSDVIYIPTVGRLASIDGKVLRPAIYELKGEMTANDLVNLAGGLEPKAFPKNSKIDRINNDGFMTVLDVDLTDLQAQSLLIEDGDHLHIDGIIDRKESIVSLVGHVYYPGQFRWHEGMRVSDILKEESKFPPNLDLDYALISRETKPIGNIEVINIDLRGVLLGNNPQADIKLLARDTIHIFGNNLERFSSLKGMLSKIKSQARSNEWAKTVSISGTVRLPGEFPLIKNMKISDLVLAAGNFSVQHTQNDYGILIRKTLPLGDIEIINLSLDKLFDIKDNPNDLTLLPSDEILLFGKDEIRIDRLNPLISKIRNQARVGELSKTVKVLGTVKFPGEYPLFKNMDISSLVKVAGGFKDAAYTQAAELSRVNLDNPELAQVNAISFSIQENKFVSDILLQPLDRVSFRAIPEFREARKIQLSGEVKFPGEYYFEQGELLGSVIQRAGGFTDFAHIEASFFTRESLKAKEVKELERLKALLEEEIALETLEYTNSSLIADDKQSARRNTIARIQSAKPTGRLVIRLRDIMGMVADDVLIEDGDMLLVPKFKQEVTVIGEVNRPVSYLFDPKFSINNYLEQSGGLKDSANRDALYIVKASGEIVVPKTSLFRFIGPSEKIQAGDTIVVPLDTDDSKIQGLPLIAEVSKILYQLALSSAAIQSFR